MRARARDARPGDHGGADRRRSPDRRDPGADRRGGPARRGAARLRRHEPRAALARVDAEAADLRARLRGRDRASRDDARGPADELRRLCAAEPRPRVSRPDDGARRRCSRRATCRRWRCSTRSARRSCWRGCAAPGCSAALPPGRPPGLAIALGGLGLTLEDLVRALRRDRPWRRGGGAARRRRAAVPGPPSRVLGADRGLVCRRRAARRAAAGERRAGPDRVQDRHQLRPPRRLGDRLRRRARDRSLVRPGRRGGAARRRSGSTPRRRRCSTPSPG